MCKMGNERVGVVIKNGGMENNQYLSGKSIGDKKNPIKTTNGKYSLFNHARISANTQRGGISM